MMLFIRDSGFITPNYSMYRAFFSLILGLFIAAAPAATFAQAEDVPLPGSGSVYCPHLSQTMVRGARDRATVPPGQVTELQHFLSDYYDIDPDDIMTGYFGVLTHRSVVRFQQEQGLPAFGIVGPMTRAAIARVCGTATVPPPSTTTCTFNGTTIADGESVLAYASSTVPWQRQCVSETRTCVKGVLTGSYKNASCVEQPCNNTVGCGPILPLTPTVSFSAKQTRVAPGTRTALVWSTTNATWCSAGGGWNGTKATSGTEETPVLWGATTFTLTCFGPGGMTPVTKSVTVSVVPEEPPVPTFSATPTSGAAPLSVSFTGSELTGGSQYIIDYGDGSNSGPLQSHCLSNQPYPGYTGPAMTCSVDASHVYPAAGTYTATLQGYVACMWSNPRCEIDPIPLGTATITVTGTGTPGVTFTAAPTSGTAPLSVTFTVGNLSNVTNRIFGISYGDGTSGTIDASGCTTNSQDCFGGPTRTSHTYTASGTYTATLTQGKVQCGNTNGILGDPIYCPKTIGTVTIAVSAPGTGPTTDRQCTPNMASAWNAVPSSGTSPLSVTVTFSIGSFYAWDGIDFGDGTKYILPSPTTGESIFNSQGYACVRHTYVTPGMYTIWKTYGSNHVGGNIYQPNPTITVR